jgi:hypothetical protein
VALTLGTMAWKEEEEEWEEGVHEGGREDEDESLGGTGNAAIKKTFRQRRKKTQAREQLTWCTQRNLPLPLPSPLPLSRRRQRNTTKTNPIILTPIIIPPLLPLAAPLRHIPHHKPHRPFRQVMRVVFQADGEPESIPSLRVRRRPQHVA